MEAPISYKSKIIVSVGLPDRLLPYTLYLNTIDLSQYTATPYPCLFIHHHHLVRAFVYMILLDANVCLNVHMAAVYRDGWRGGVGGCGGRR